MDSRWRWVGAVEGEGGGGVNVIQHAREKHPRKWEVSVNAVPAEAC